MIEPDGIAEQPVTSYELQVYPNPTTGELRVTSYELQVTSIEIFDVYGKKEKGEGRREKGEGEMVLDISHLPAGFYFVRIQTDTGTVTKKVVKH